VTIRFVQECLHPLSFSRGRNPACLTWRTLYLALTGQYSWPHVLYLCNKREFSQYQCLNPGLFFQSWGQQQAEVIAPMSALLCFASPRVQHCWPWGDVLGTEPLRILHVWVPIANGNDGWSTGISLGPCPCAFQEPLSSRQHCQLRAMPTMTSLDKNRAISACTSLNRLFSYWCSRSCLGNPQGRSLVLGKGTGTQGLPA